MIAKGPETQARVMVRTTMKRRGQSAESIDTQFYSVAHAVKFAANYMELAPKAHEHVEWIRFELPPEKSTSRKPARKPARKKR